MITVQKTDRFLEWFRGDSRFVFNEILDKNAIAVNEVYSGLVDFVLNGIRGAEIKLPFVRCLLVDLVPHHELYDGFGIRWWIAIVPLNEKTICVDHRGSFLQKTPQIAQGSVCVMILLFLILLLRKQIYRSH